MIEPTRFLLFIGVSWALILAPGPDLLYVITRGVSQGRRAGMLSALGVIGGILVHTTAAAFGLTLILQTSALAFLIVKYIGAGYLIYLGIKAWREKSTFQVETIQGNVSFRKVFWQGVLSNVFNPKIAIFFLAFLPQFVEKDRGNVPLQMAAIGLTFAFFGLCFLLTVGYSSGTIGGWLASRPHYTQLLGRLAGGILVGLGLRLAFTQRR